MFAVVTFWLAVLGTSQLTLLINISYSTCNYNSFPSVSI